MITGIFALIIGIGCFWFSYKFIKTFYQVKGWVKTEATVVTKGIELHKKFSAGRNPYAVKVEYTYAYEDKPFQNSTLNLAELIGGQSNYMESTANKVVAGINDKMQIYVNPKNPSQSVMFCDGLGLYILMALLGFIALIISGVNLLT